MNKRQNILAVLLDIPEKDISIAQAELSSLISTANGHNVGTIIQKRSTPNNATLVGSGKVQEIIEYCDANDIDLIVFDDRLSATQRRNINNLITKHNADLKIDIIDKVDLILDIFSQRAVSKEGKQQVELAQLQYRMATKSNVGADRQGGGIGSRGPGETKLETNRRLIKSKIDALQSDINQSATTRNTQLKHRRDSQVFTVALVGYTNAGKSTLFNKLTGNNIFAEDMLFATLDTTARKLKLPSGISVVITDTVGFIRDLPHELISAFKSTLDESIHADLVLVVSDISSQQMDMQLHVCHTLLNELGCNGTIIDVYNKIDAQPSNGSAAIVTDDAMHISAITGRNIDLLLELIDNYAQQQYSKVKLFCQYGSEQQALISKLHKHNINYTANYNDNDIVIEAIIPNNIIKNFSIETTDSFLLANEVDKNITTRVKNED